MALSNWLKSGTYVRVRDVQLMNSGEESIIRFSTDVFSKKVGNPCSEDDFTTLLFSFGLICKRSDDSDLYDNYFAESVVNASDTNLTKQCYEYLKGTDYINDTSDV